MRDRPRRPTATTVGVAALCVFYPVGIQWHIQRTWDPTDRVMLSLTKPLDAGASVEEVLDLAADLGCRAGEPDARDAGAAGLRLWKRVLGVDVPIAYLTSDGTRGPPVLRQLSDTDEHVEAEVRAIAIACLAPWPVAIAAGLGVALLRRRDRAGREWLP